MKKLFVFLCIVILSLGLLLYNIPGEPPPEDAPSTAPSTETEPIAPVQPGQVQFINDEPERQAAWEAIAADFQKQTGIEVTIVQPVTYSIDLEKATLFTLTDEDDLTQWADQCYDLSCTQSYAQLASWNLVLQQEGKVCGIPADTECFGLVYNAELLAQAGYTSADINSFSDLKKAAQSITANSADLGFAAFAAPALNGSLTEHFPSLTGDLRAFWDLYIHNTTRSTDALSTLTQADGLADLLKGKAVFMPAGTGDYESLAALSDHQLAFMPLYTGGENEENGVLHVQVHSYFCIRSDAPDQDIQAALAFLSYLVHPAEDGTVPLDTLGLLAPYRQATFAGNKLETAFRKELTSGRTCLNCARPKAPDGLTQALIAYAADPTDENWNAVNNLL